MQVVVIYQILEKKKLNCKDRNNAFKFLGLIFFIYIVIIIILQMLNQFCIKNEKINEKLS